MFIEKSNLFTLFTCVNMNVIRDTKKEIRARRKERRKTCERKKNTTESAKKVKRLYRPVTYIYTHYHQYIYMFSTYGINKTKNTEKKVRMKERKKEEMPTANRPHTHLCKQTYIQSTYYYESSVRWVSFIL